MKRFDESWTKEEVSEYLLDQEVLVLFKIDNYLGEALLDIQTKRLTTSQKDQLHRTIASVFGKAKGNLFTFNKINEFANKWVNKNILKKKARVINFKKRSV